MASCRHLIPNSRCPVCVIRKIEREQRSRGAETAALKVALLVLVVLVIAALVINAPLLIALILLAGLALTAGRARSRRR